MIRLLHCLIIGCRGDGHVVALTLQVMLFVALNCYVGLLLYYDIGHHLRSVLT